MIRHYMQSFYRNVTKNRFFYSINLIGFLSGFLLFTIIFTFVYQELSFDRFHRNAANIYRIHSGGYGVTPLCFGEKLRNKIPEITGVVRFCSNDLIIVVHHKDVEIGRTYYTDSVIFQFFSFKLLSGNPSTVLKAPYSIVLNQTTANRLFGSDAPIGKVISDTNGTQYTITGIMEDIPYNSHIQSNAFISIETLHRNGNDNEFNCGSWSNLTYVSLSEKTNPVLVEQKLNSVLDDSKMRTSDGKIPLQLQLLKNVYFDSDHNKYDDSRHGNQQSVWLYWAISVLLLLIVIINYINLSIAIYGNRVREMAICKVNGAGQLQIVQQILIESVGVALISYFVTVLIIELLLPQLSHLLNLTISNSFHRGQLYFYCLLGVVLIGIVTGLVPGILLSRIHAIKALRNQWVLNSRGTQRKILLVIQLLIVAVLLNSTFMIKKQITYVLKKDMGFRYENIVFFDLDKTLQDKEELLKKILLENKNIESVTFSNQLFGDKFTKHPVKVGNIDEMCNFISVDPDYLKLYHIKLKRGRDFSFGRSTDVSGSSIVNEQACRTFGIENPIGKLIGNKEIIGVVTDFNFTSLHNKMEPLILNCGKGKVIQIKIQATNRAGTLSFLQKVCEEISPGFECNYSFLEDRVQGLYQSELDLQSSFEVFTMITFLIALLGLFGLTLFTIRKKTKEISIRILFGASLKDTWLLFAKDQILIVCIANLLAVPLSWIVINQWLHNFQYKVMIGFDGFILSFLITIIFTLLAISILIVRTHRTNLIVSLKYE